MNPHTTSEGGSTRSVDMDRFYDPDNDVYVIPSEDFRQMTGVRQGTGSWNSGRSEDPDDDTYDIGMAGVAPGGSAMSTSGDSASLIAELIPLERKEVVTLGLTDVTSGHAHDLLLRLQRNADKSGMCLLTRLRPSKEHGYVQVS